MAQGLEAAHQVGIVHRDFKSANVILVPGSAGERAVITDFGMAALDPTMLGPSDTRTIEDVAHIAGTVAYMSPEQMTGGTITVASDIYSLGVVLFEMATGKRPFDDRHLVHSAWQRASDSGIAVRPLAPNIDPRWESAIKHCLRKEPKQRFQSAAELATWFGGGSWTAPRLWTRRQWIQRSTAVAGPVLAGAGFWFWWQLPYQPAPAALEAYARGLNALHSMTYEAARRQFELAVKADPKFALAHAGLARAYDEMDYTERATEEMLHAHDATHEGPLSRADDRRLSAWGYMISREYDKAAPLFRQLEDSASGPGKAAAALESGWLAQQRDETDVALTDYQRALKLRPGYAAAKLRLGSILQRKRKDAQALQAFDEAKALYHEAADIEGEIATLIERASLLHRRNRLQEAMSAIEDGLLKARAVANKYQEIRLEQLKGVVLRKLNDFPGAVELARKANAEAEVEHMYNLAANGSSDLGNALLDKGDRELAKKAFDQALELARRGKVRRQEIRALVSLGSLYEQNEQPREAIQPVEEALRFYQQAAFRTELIQAKTVLGGALDQLAEYQQAISVLVPAADDAAQLQDRGLEAGLRNRLANTYRDRGDWLLALDEYTRTIDAVGANPFAESVRVWLADIQWKLGRRREAELLVLQVQSAQEKNGDGALGSVLRAQQARMAYDDGKWKQALDLSKGPGLSWPDDVDLSLTRALSRIQIERSAAAGEAAMQVIQRLERAGMSGYAAAARLSAAEAWLAAGDSQRGRQSLGNALEFFENTRVVESLWRAHAIAARLAASSEDEARHWSAASVRLGELGTAWGPEVLSFYRSRRDIKELAKTLQ
jgi:tetratricopeptide (TPR) repeat protein